MLDGFDTQQFLSKKVRDERFAALVKKLEEGAALTARERTEYEQERQRLIEKANKAQRRARAEAGTSRVQQLLPQTSKGAHGGSPMEQAAHLAGLNPENLAFEILMNYICSIGRFVFQIDYMMQCTAYNNAIRQDEANSADSTARPLAYRQDRDGSWPETYRLGSDGQPDYENPIRGQASYAEVLANGYVPAPDLLTAWETTAAHFVKDMHGDSKLSPWQQTLLNMPKEAAEKAGRKGDLASDNLARMAAMRQQAAPRPPRAGGH